MAFTVKDFISSYDNLHVNQRKNQADFHIAIVMRESGKKLYSDTLTGSTIYIKPEYLGLEVLSWFFDYKLNTIILSVPFEKELEDIED